MNKNNKIKKMVSESICTKEKTKKKKRKIHSDNKTLSRSILIMI